MKSSTSSERYLSLLDEDGRPTELRGSPAGGPLPTELAPGWAEPLCENIVVEGISKGEGLII